MKIQINAKDLQNVLKKSKGLELRKLSVDVQKGLLISANDEITLTMNNITTQFESVVTGDIVEPGQVLIPESTLKLLENFKNGEIFITDKSIIYNTKEISFMSGPAEDFHKTDNAITNLLFETTESELTRLLEVNYATTTNTARPILEGINIYKNRFAATNGYYMGIRESDFYTHENITISQNLWKTLLKAIDKKSDDPIKVFWDKDKLIKFQFTDFEVTGNLFEGDYLDLDKILKNENTTKLILNTKELLKSVRLMKKLKGDRQLIRLQVDNPLKTESGDNYNTIADEIQVSEFEGQPLEIWFNIDYFYDVMNQYKNETVEMEFTSETGPIFIKSDKKLEFLLPVKPRTEV